MSALSVLYERVRKYIAPFSGPIEHVILEGNSNTNYIFFAKAGTLTSEAKWLGWRVQQSGSYIKYRMARTSATATDQEQFNKIADDAATYNYVD